MKTFSVLFGLAATAMGAVNPDVAPDAAPAGEPQNSGAATNPTYYSSREVKIIQTGNIVTAEPPVTGRAKALYTMTNDGKHNVLLAIPINEKNGWINTTAPVARYEMGGVGARFPVAPGTVPFEDALDSQGSVVRAGARLFAVNAGSHTFQTFAINCTNATHLIPLGKPVRVNGFNPTTLAVAPESQIVCVATTGNQTGIECYNYQVGFGDPSTAINTPQFFTGTKVNLPLPVAQKGPLPTGPTDTVSQILITDDERKLIAVVKGAADSSGKISGGYINIYTLSENGLSAPTQSKPTGTSLLFGCTLKYNSYDLFCSDAAIGAVQLKLDGSTNKYKVTHTAPTKNFGGRTNCWAQRSPFANGPNYISAIDGNQVATFNKTDGTLTGGIGSQFVFKNGNPQSIEMATGNNYVYGLSIGNKTYPPHIQAARNLDFGAKFFAPANNNFMIPGAGSDISGIASFTPFDENNACDFA